MDAVTRVDALWDDLAQLIHDEVIDALTDDRDPTTAHLPIPPRIAAWATAVADQVRDNVMNKLDAL